MITSVKVFAKQSGEKGLNHSQMHTQGNNNARLCQFVGEFHTCFLHIFFQPFPDFF